MYFTNGKLYTFECKMVTKLNFQKRGDGFRIMSLNHRKTKKIIVNHYSCYEDMLFRMLKEIRYSALTERVNQVMHKNIISESIFKDDSHRMRFANLLKAGELQGIRSSPAFVSAMFLLTADPFVWYRTGRCANDGVICFYDSQWGANQSNQILYQTARDLYFGIILRNEYHQIPPKVEYSLT